MKSPRLIGAGGMGEVYRATRHQLNRDVALKVLPEAVAADRIAWLASSAKPRCSPRSIIRTSRRSTAWRRVAIGSRALVMELVEGPTICRDRIAAVRPLDDALPIARQIADALEAAHERASSTAI